MGGGWRHIFFGVRIDETGDQIGQTGFFRFNAVVLLKQVGDRFRIFGNGAPPSPPTPGRESGGAAVEARLMEAGAGGSDQKTICIYRIR